MINHYALSVPSGRPLLPHGFTVNSLWRKRFNENTTPIALTLNLVVPFINGFNARLEEHIAAAEDPDATLLLNDAKVSLRTAVINFADASARVCIQTALAAALIEKNTPLGNSVVYQWDMFPRLHRHYVGALLDTLHLPVWLSTLLGPPSNPVEIMWFAMPVSASAAFQDSVARHVLPTVADIAVGSTKAALMPDGRAPSQPRLHAAIGHTVQSVTLLLTRATGAAVGQKVSPGKGEYWGEIAGVVAGGVIAAKLLVRLRLRSSEKPSKAV